VTTNEDPTSYKNRTALKLKIPVVSPQYLRQCASEQKYLEPDSFLLMGKSATDNFSSGKISQKRARVEHSSSSASSFASGAKRYKTSVSLKDIKVWAYRDPKAPPFPEDGHEIAKYVTLLKEEAKMGITFVTHLELHVAMAPSSLPNTHPFRVFSQSAFFSREDPRTLKDSRKECRLLGTVWDAEDIYSQLFQDAERKGFRKLPKDHPLPELGSEGLQRERSTLSGPGIPESLKELINEIFSEADAEVAQAMSESHGVPTLNQIEEGEGYFQFPFEAQTPSNESPPPFPPKKLF